ncbi:MAG: ABC transporter permease [Deltaproteobacteria bacterium]|nr:ABC transporter permease [Deltaproteobacteria bacterium]
MAEPAPEPTSAAAPGPAAPGAAPPPAAPPPGEPEVALGNAVWIGVKDAFSPITRFLDVFGGHLMLAGRAFAWLPRRPVRTANYLEAADYIGVGSLPIVLLVGAFTGMVMSLQSVYAFRTFNLESYAGGVTAKALALELSPVLTALMLAGRAGAGIATELGTMRITEQIDALESMAVNPVQFLVLPRVVAGMIVGPMLSLLSFIVGMAGAYFVAVVIQGIDHGQYVANVKSILTISDVAQGVIKSVVFGMLVILIGCYQGYNASGGGRGVGLGTTRAVVTASASILILDYFLSDLLLTIMGGPAT